MEDLIPWKTTEEQAGAFWTDKNSNCLFYLFIDMWNRQTETAYRWDFSEQHWYFMKEPEKSKYFRDLSALKGSGYIHITNEEAYSLFGEEPFKEVCLWERIHFAKLVKTRFTNLILTEDNHG